MNRKINRGGGGVLQKHKGVQSKSNEPKRVSNCKEKQSKLDKYLCFAIQAMAIMASYCFFIHMNVKEFKPKIYLMNFKFKF
jgi:hypothetical protein